MTNQPNSAAFDRDAAMRDPFDARQLPANFTDAGAWAAFGYRLARSSIVFWSSLTEAMLRANAALPKAKQADSAESGSDDLKAVPGIGPKLESVLKRGGVGTYAALAALDRAAVQRLEQELGLAGRTLRDNWIDHAGTLAAAKRNH